MSDVNESIPYDENHLAIKICNANYDICISVENKDTSDYIYNSEAAYFGGGDE